MTIQLLLRRIFLSAVLVTLPVCVFSQPLVHLDPGLTSVRVDRVGFRQCAMPSVDISLPPTDTARSLGRSYRNLAPDSISYPFAGVSEVLETDWRRGGYFDLWELFSGNKLNDPRAILLEFFVEAAGLDSCYLSLGFNDCGVVFVDQKAIWGVGGGREHNFGQNIVPIKLNQGRALISLLMWKKSEWTQVPADHFSDEWGVNISLCPTADAAWAAYVSNNFHFLDSPVVKSPDDLRFDVALRDHKDVGIFNLKGEKVATGSISEIGTLKLDRPAEFPPEPFVGIIVMGGGIAEAVVFEGDSTVDLMLDQLLADGARQVDDWKAWEFRCRHLLKPAFLQSRNNWWARKLALSYAMAGLQTNFSRLAEPFCFWGSSRIEFQPYLSGIDGTTQHYRALVGALQDGRSRPLAIFLPGAPMPVRPFLESYGVSDMNETEVLARLADSYGVDLLWPGNVDIDYGGNHTRRWVDEALQAFQMKYPAKRYRPIYLVGTCAAGVAALGYAETYGGVDGVVYWSPIVTRDAYRWPVRDKAWPPVLPVEAMEAEAVGRDLPKLKSLPMFCLFDINVPGHGDRDGTKYFLDALAGVGGKVTGRWVPSPDPVLQWGVRATDSEREWLSWIARNSPSIGPRHPRRPSVEPRTIKDALLDGYTIEPLPTGIEDTWAKNWLATVAEYRGEVPDFTKNIGGVRVQFIQKTFEQLGLSLESAEGASVRKGIPGWDRLMQNYSELWRVQMKSGSPLKIEVEHYGTAGSTSGPAFDLFREGCCRGVLWGFRNGGWELLQVWL